MKQSELAAPIVCYAYFVDNIIGEQLVLVIIWMGRMKKKNNKIFLFGQIICAVVLEGTQRHATASPPQQQK